MSQAKDLNKMIQDLALYNRMLKIMSIMPDVFSMKNDYLIVSLFDNKSSKFLIISNNIQKILGYKHSEMEGKDFRDFVVFTQEQKAAQAEVEKNIQKQVPVGQFDLWYKHKDGKNAVWLRWDATPVNKKGETFCVARVMGKKPIDQVKPFH